MDSTEQGATDVRAVVVPDFTGPRALAFEARTLFFLASWIEAPGGDGRTLCGPHLCCIGEPPESVRRLAARAGATWSVYEPLLLEYGGFANKLRGLEAPAGAGRLLLLDADMLVLGGFAAFSGIDADLAAAPAGKPQVPEAQWRLIYAGLDLPLPDERVASAYGQSGAPLENVARRYPGQAAEAAAMLPYYNSGVLLVRRPAGLRAVWEDHLRRIPAIFQDGAVTAAHAVMAGDQVALATAVQALRSRGAAFQQLPPAGNARLIHFRTGMLRVATTTLLHAAGFAGSVRHGGDLLLAVRHYEERWSHAIRQGLDGDAAACEQDLGRAHAFLWNLWERWVRPVWR